MDIIDAIILGIIQGLTEFLPVSSSGHLELGKAILGDSTLPEESLLFTVVLHFATALSTLVVFRKDIFDIIKGLFQFKWNEESQFSFKIIISMLPATVIGVLFNDQIENLFSKQILLVGAMLLITGLLLWNMKLDNSVLVNQNLSGLTCSMPIIIGLALCTIYSCIYSINNDFIHGFCLSSWHFIIVVSPPLTLLILLIRHFDYGLEVQFWVYPVALFGLWSCCGCMYLYTSAIYHFTDND